MVPPVSLCSTKEASKMENAYPPKRAKYRQRLPKPGGFALDVDLIQIIATAEKAIRKLSQKPASASILVKMAA